MVATMYINNDGYDPNITINDFLEAIMNESNPVESKEIKELLPAAEGLMLKAKEELIT